jgi:hypothetical protein
MEDRAGRDLGAERESDPDRVVDRLRIDDRQRSGQTEARRADVGVGRVAERQLAAAEHLRPRLELNVDLQADDRLELGLAHDRMALASKPIACSNA